MTELQKAIQILNDQQLTCVVLKDDQIYTSLAKGIAPVLDLMTQKVDLNGFVLADRVIGKSVALLAVKAGIREVHSDLISQHALEVFKTHHIPVVYTTLVERILNNTQTGFCPMESTVIDENHPDVAYELLKNKLAELRSRR